jgi:asparagine synthase (glutamine-hydrolysing)
MKLALKNAMRGSIPPAIMDRKDKMGFPTPIVEWARGEAREFIHDVLTCDRALNRDLIDNRRVAESLGDEGAFGRKLWGLLSLELWQQEFHDKAGEYRTRLTGSDVGGPAS